MELGGVGVWSGQLRWADAAAVGEIAAELEALGYSALWTPGGIGGDIFNDCRRILAATRRVPVATGILNLWMHSPSETATGHHELTTEFPGRFLLGIGVSHGPLVDSTEAGRYRQPMRMTRDYLEALDAASPPVPRDERVLAALGPKMLDLARELAGGSHPYNVPPEHSAVARDALGPDRMLLPEQGVVLETDPAAAREAGRAYLATYVGFPNYTNNWKRFGMTDDDLADGGSDRLVDLVVAWGDEAAIAARVQAHLDAGADHVCIQVLGAGADTQDVFRRLAPALVGLRRPT
jgi:probable F420-dependent oxidoreductase